jgi:hypothetical protein
MNYGLGYIDLEEKTLQPLENPFGPKRAAVNEKCKDLATRKRVNGGITDKKPNASAASIPLCFAFARLLRG